MNFPTDFFNKVINGDCIEILKQLPDNSIDSIVTDPPYELGFMGKEWDKSGIAYNVLMWKEALRVLKPGGHLLAFGGTRTYHRMAVAIEDAGFEIRDMIEWVYGCLSEDTEILTINGWEYYHKNIDKNPVLCYNIAEDSFEFWKPKRSFCYENQHTAYRIKSDKTDQIVSRNHRVLVEREGKLIFKTAETLERQENIPFLESLSNLSETICNIYKGTSIKKQDLLSRVQKCDIAKKEKKTNSIFNRNNLYNLWQKISNKKKQGIKILFSSMQWKSKRTRLEKTCLQRQSKMETGKRASIKRKNDWRKKLGLERWSNLFQKARKLCCNKVCEMSERIFGNGSERWLCYGTSVNNGSILKQKLAKSRGGASYKPQSTRQPLGKSSTICIKQRTQITRSTITPIEYKGKVWCVEVPTGAFVARRNGKIFITGNSGFPKSLNIGKAVDKLQGNKREIIGEKKRGDVQLAKEKGVGYLADEANRNNIKQFGYGTEILTKGTSAFEGWGTALKPSHESICVARKPISEKTIAENCLKWGTGGINIDECRVELKEEKQPKGSGAIHNKTNEQNWGFVGNGGNETSALGRFPANLIHDGSDEVKECFPETQERFFKSIIYTSKASKKERNAGCEELEEKDFDGGSIKHNNLQARCSNCGDRHYDCNGKCSCGLNQFERREVKNHHPTVKPVQLMAYLCRLVTPKQGIVLDPFTGSGSTLIAAKQEGFNYIGIELNPEYIKIAEARLNKKQNIVSQEQEYKEIIQAPEISNKPKEYEQKNLFE